MDEEIEELRTKLASCQAHNVGLREALSSIYQYGSDSLSGPTTGPDDRAWQREGVLEMTRRAKAALSSTIDTEALDTAIAKAVEGCAKVAEDTIVAEYEGVSQYGGKAAEAIRARGKL